MSRAWLPNLLVAAAYWLAGVGVRWFLAPYGLFPAPFWPSASIALAAAYIGGPRLWPGIWAGSFLANFTLFGASAPLAAAISTTNTLAPLVAVHLLHRSSVCGLPFSTLRGVFAFVLFGALTHGLLAATGGVGFSLLFGALPADAILSAWLRWALSDTGGTFFFAPAIILLWKERTPAISAAQWLELAGVVALVLATLLAFFMLHQPLYLVAALPYLLVVPLVWVTVRFSLGIGAILFSIVAIAATLATVQGVGPFQLAGIERPLVTLGFMVVSLSLTTLSVGCLVNERREAERLLRESNELLERRVEERTRDLSRSREALRDQVRLQQSLVDAIPTPVYFVDAEGRLQGCNDAFVALVGRGREALDGIRIEELVGLRGEASDGSGEESMGSRHVIHHRAPYTSGNGMVAGSVGALIDITERKRLEDELRRQASFDVLTGLNNRRYFYEQGERELARARRHGSPLIALVIDLDHFKTINDTYGHAVGDDAIALAAATCRAVLRDSDLIGRLGGDEFAALLPDTDEAGGRLAAERLSAALRATSVPTPEGPAFLSGSIGVSSLTQEDGGLDDLMAKADRAMYATKQARLR